MRTHPTDLLNQATKTRWLEIQQTWDITRVCPRCEGRTTIPHYKWSILKNPEFEHMVEPCRNCHDGMFARPNFAMLLDMVASVYKGKIRFKSARPKYGKTNLDNRAYYCWRIARFNGGQDVTMPVMASMELGADPYVKELEFVSDVFASIFFGTHMAGALRWGPLLGGITEEQAREYMRKNPQPSTADPSGPVVIGSKPESERPEIDEPNENGDLFDYGVNEDDLDDGGESPMQSRDL